MKSRQDSELPSLSLKYKFEVQWWQPHSTSCTVSPRLES
jgi:hypothetical protein